MMVPTKDLKFQKMEFMFMDCLLTQAVLTKKLVSYVILDQVNILVILFIYIFRKYLGPKHQWKPSE